MWGVSSRFHTMAAGSHTSAVKVEVWSLGKKLGEAGPDQDPIGEAYFSEGSVTDQFVIGARRSISLSVPQNRIWLEWLTKPALELRPFTGIDFGGHIEWCPHGRFVVKSKPRNLKPGELSLKANDFWERVKDADFIGPAMYGGGLTFELRGIIRQFIAETGPYTVQELATSTSRSTPNQVWEKSRHDTIVDLCQAASATAYFDRTGTPVLENWFPKPSVLTLENNIIDVRTETSWTKVYNQVIASSTAQPPTFPPQSASITDPLHPAYRANLGGDVVKRFSSSLLTTADQARSAAYALLSKHSAPARTLSVSIVPNPSLDAGDVISVLWPGQIGSSPLPYTSTLDGPDVVRIQQITHPLGAGPQQITAQVAGGSLDEN